MVRKSYGMREGCCWWQYHHDCQVLFLVTKGFKLPPILLKVVFNSHGTMEYTQDVDLLLRPD